MLQKLFTLESCETRTENGLTIKLAVRYFFPWFITSTEVIDPLLSRVGLNFAPDPEPRIFISGAVLYPYPPSISF